MKDGLRVQRRAVQRVRPGQAHLRHRDVGVRGRRRRPAAFERPRRRSPRTVRARQRVRPRRSPSATCSSSTRARSSSSCARTTRATRPRWSRASPAFPRSSSSRSPRSSARLGRPDKVMTVVYAVGLTHHTTGGQLIRDRRHPPAPARQHGPAGRRHERRARPRQHPGQHRQRDLVGDPARLPAHPGARPEEPRRLRRPERAPEVRHQRRGTSSAPTTGSSW